MASRIPLTYDHLDSLIVQAFRAGRACIEPIREAIQPVIGSLRSGGSERLIAAIEDRKIMSPKVMDEIHALLVEISPRIDAGTSETSHVDDCDGYSTTPHLVVSVHRTPEAEALYQAQRALEAFASAITDVQDVRDAERTMDWMRGVGS